jgi:hypothetical protein
VTREVRLDPAPSRVPPVERKAPLLAEGRYAAGTGAPALHRGGNLRCGAQADFNRTSTLSLSRPVTGSLFCF